MISEHLQPACFVNDVQKLRGHGCVKKVHVIVVSGKLCTQLFKNEVLWDCIEVLLYS